MVALLKFGNAIISFDSLLDMYLLTFAGIKV